MQTHAITRKLKGRRSETRSYAEDSYSALCVTYSSTDTIQPEVGPAKVIRHITKFGEKDLTAQYLGGAEILEKQVTGRSSDMVVFQRDNGGRRLGLERRRFSYDLHVPERRSNIIRRNKLDRRNDFFPIEFKKMA